VTQIAGGLVGRPPARQLVSRNKSSLASAARRRRRCRSRPEAAVTANADNPPRVAACGQMRPRAGHPPSACSNDLCRFEKPACHVAPACGRTNGSSASLVAIAMARRQAAGRQKRSRDAGSRPLEMGDGRSRPSAPPALAFTRKRKAAPRAGFKQSTSRPSVVSPSETRTCARERE